MNPRLSDEQEEIFQRLTGEWILSRADISGQIEGCAIIMATLNEIIVQLLGEVASRAIMSRAAIATRREYPLLASVVILEDGLDVAGLETKLRGADPRETGNALAGLIGEIFGVLRRLLGRAAIPIFRDLQTELAAKRNDPLMDEESS